MTNFTFIQTNLSASDYIFLAGYSLVLKLEYIQDFLNDKQTVH